MRSGASYRAWQFFQTLRGSITDQGWLEISQVLSPPELELFLQLPVPDQNHSLRVYQALQADQESDPDLLKAALLHDLGKSRHPLRRWERILAVLAVALFPAWSRAGGDGKPAGLKRALVVINQHAGWGAELAEAAGSPPRTVWLIRYHEGENPPDTLPEEDLALLLKLKEADNQN